MKLLIIEGCDRTGKDTVINTICSLYSNVIKSHWGYPKGESNDQKTKYQKR
jgi:thymidylate kinase